MNTTNIVVGTILGLVTIIATIVSATYILSGDIHEVEIRVLEKLDKKHTNLDNKFDQKFDNLNDKISKLDNKAVGLRIKVNEIADRLDITQLTKAPDALKKIRTMLDDKIVEISKLRNKINELEEGNDGLEAKLETAKNELRDVSETYYLLATNRKEAIFAEEYIKFYNNHPELGLEVTRLEEMKRLLSLAAK